MHLMIDHRKVQVHMYMQGKNERHIGVACTCTTSHGILLREELNDRGSDTAVFVMFCGMIPIAGMFLSLSLFISSITFPQMHTVHCMHLDF